MEQELDAMNLPQSFTTHRSFLSPLPAEHPSEPSSTSQRGALATFSLRILFRQNSSWQGTVTWLEGNLEQCFRSVLELIHLMDSSLQALTSTSQPQTSADA